MSLNPVIVLVKSPGCGYCIQLSKIWENKVIPALKKINSNLISKIITFEDASPGVSMGKFPDNEPRTLLHFTHLLPTIFLMTEQIWQKINVDKKSILPIDSNIQIYNYKRVFDDKTQKVQFQRLIEYNPSEISGEKGFTTWFEKSFKMINNSNINSIPNNSIPNSDNLSQKSSNHVKELIKPLNNNDDFCEYYRLIPRK